MCCACTYICIVIIPHHVYMCICTLCTYVCVLGRLLLCVAFWCIILSATLLSPPTPHPPGVPMFVTNTDVFGYLVPSSEKLQSLDEARQAFVNFKLKTLGRREYTVWSCEPCGINMYLLVLGWGGAECTDGVLSLCYVKWFCFLSETMSPHTHARVRAHTHTHTRLRSEPPAHSCQLSGLPALSSSTSGQSWTEHGKVSHTHHFINPMYSYCNILTNCAIIFINCHSPFH